METNAFYTSHLRYWAALILLGGLLLLLLLPHPALPLFEEFRLRTSPPPDAAIELSDVELAAIQSAYESGFDHPDPGGGDPCQRLRLLPYKKLSAWRKQFRKRGFTIAKIQEMLRSGRRELYVHPEKGHTFTKIYDPQGNWIVVDFIDCIIWQVAPHNFK